MYLINKQQEHLYRPNVGCVLLKENKIFIAKRLGYTTDAWQMPQGGVDNGEDYETALFRELMEEIGTNNIKVLQESTYYRYYKVPQNLSVQIWGGKYIGQKQKWFLAEFQGEDSEINIHTPKPEFEDWKWSSANNILRKSVFFKRDIYTDVLGEFGLK